MNAATAWGVLALYFEGADDLTDEECKAVDVLGEFLKPNEHVLYMSAQTVREHLDGDEEYEEALKWADNETIASLLGDEPLYEAWAETCRRIGDELIELREAEAPDEEDAAYERAQASDEWQRRHGGGL